MLFLNKGFRKVHLVVFGLIFIGSMTIYVFLGCLLLNVSVIQEPYSTVILVSSLMSSILGTYFLGDGD